MVAEQRTCSRDMERSECLTQGKCKRKRKRRRRKRSKGRCQTVSTLISPIKRWNAGSSTTVDADSSTIPFLELKESQRDKSLEESSFARPCYPGTFSTTFSKPGPRDLKRKQLFADGNDLRLCPGHLTCKRAAWMISEKNAIVHLNELRPGLQYEIVSKTSPVHAPVFSASVEVNGFHFEGQGPSKRWAKMRAAELALQSFVQFPNASQAHATMASFTSTSMDFTENTMDISTTFFKDFNQLLCDNTDYSHYSTAFPSIYHHRGPVQYGLSSYHLSPVVLLNELRPGLKYICVKERIHGRPMKNFVMVLKLDGRVFEGYGHSKRQARGRAAATALQALYNISFQPEKKMMGLQASKNKHQLPQFFAESIVHLVKEKYTALKGNCAFTSHVHPKVLAGIVMTRGVDLRSALVVSLATGTKCLDLDPMSDCSYALSDCHAEIICRRAFIRFLYSQLEMLLCKADDTVEYLIFQPNKGPGSINFQLKNGVLFHMYVSLSPCGDARLNCPYEATTAYSSRRSCCHLRVKVNGGEGTLPIMEPKVHQKGDGLSQPELYTAMSCTDKMAKWSVVGLQGALLSHLMKPVYLHSLTVGTLGHTGHLGRVMTRRLSSVRNLPHPYRRQPLMLGCLDSRQVSPAGKSSTVSLNWSLGDVGLEEISSSTGRRRRSEEPSHLSRHSLFTRWVRLQQQLKPSAWETEAPVVTYCASKMAAGCYQRTLQQFTSALQSAGLGKWSRKPSKCSNFTVGE
ncbi:double-stranded RNA-specific editase B2-like [Gouania willdenowi]|uniref:double-stranded RNA-specific editase B2-like n=1 Tax=Gouania willdenowi TaxID=441366 RepID=UPI00105504C1|nr:double-stranded RNA-specific editase B2 [Gouania willdenowi]